MSEVKRDIDGFLQQVRLGVDNSQNAAEINAALAAFGFGAAELADGAAKLAAAEGLQADQKDAYGVQQAATVALKTAFAEADKVYAMHRKLAKIAFSENKDAQVSLQLDKRKARGLDAWMGQTKVFYDNLLDHPDWVTAMGRFNVTDLILQAAQAAVDNVSALNSAQENAKGRAQKSTQVRNAALDEMDLWYSEFRKIARIALAEDAQMLESLGLGSA